MLDVVSMGESVIDLTPTGFSSSGNPTYEQHPGGAACNVAVAVSKLGGSSAFVGAVGDDEFGRFLRGTLRAWDVDDSGLVTTSDAHTTLAFVHLAPNGERTFTVLGFPGAESHLDIEDVGSESITRARIFHLGSAILTADPSRSTALRVLRRTKRNRDQMTSFDVNYRPILWSPEAARALAESVMPLIDILKVSQEELQLLTGTADLESGTNQLLERGPSLIGVSLGAEGSYFSSRAGSGLVANYVVKATDTNGAGDAFLAALLWQISRSNSALSETPVDELREMFDFANAAGAIAASRPGALAASPTLADVQKLRASQTPGAGQR